MKDLILDLLTAVIVVAIGLLNYKKLSMFYRLLIFQTFIYVVVDVVGVLAGLNAWLFNLQIPVEAALLFSAAQTYFKNGISKWVLLILFAALLIMFFIDVFWLSNIWFAAFHTLIFEGLLISGIYITVLFLQFMKTNNRSIDIALVIASIGIIVYFAVSIPYLSMMSSLQGEDPTQNQKLFRSIVVVLGDIRYLFIAIAIYMAARSTKNSSLL